jgi:hypothetical protein
LSICASAVSRALSRSDADGIFFSFSAALATGFMLS